MTPGQKLVGFRSIFIAIAACLVSSRAYSTPGDLYVAEATGGGHVYKFTSAGNRSTFASGIYQPVALAFDRAGNLFVANSGASGCIPEVDCPPKPSTIIKIIPDGTQSTFATLQASQLLGVAFDGAGNLFVSTGNSIVKVAPDGTQSTFASQLHGAWPMSFDTSGNLFVGLNPIGSSSIVKFAPDGSSTTFVTLSGSSSSITGLAFGAAGDLYVRAGSSILKIRPDGSRTTFATNDRFNYPLAFDASGVLFAGLNAYNSTEPAIVKFTSAGAATTFAFGPLLPTAFAFEPVTEKVRNISARGLVGGGDNTLIGGFIIGGSPLANNALIVRAIGPSLAGSGVTNPLSDPVLELRDSSGAVIATNNDWQDTQKTQITASGVAPTDPRESAIFATLPTGNYTAVVRSADNTAGIAVVEVFSVSQ
ncbi:MAG TPA: hypothetical protein VE031_01355 [Chthoniobacterales bacterium]|nr:hypothetical protein [Chthoniobacterales bacterium]